MALLTILKEGEEVLRKKSRPVDNINDRITRLLDDMKDTLAESGGVGLAAVQVGVLRRVVIIDLGEGPVIELINPEIVSTEGEREVVEGCLSCPGKWALKKRPEKVVARAQNRNGELVTYEADGLFAQALCHETEHLEGKLFVDDIIRFVDENELE